MTLFRRLLAGLMAMVPTAAPALAPPLPAPSTEAEAINGLGLDLLGRVAARGNALISPYSIQCALAMTYAGSDGATRAEMQRTLHYPEDETKLHSALAALGASLEQIAKSTAERAAESKRRGGPSEAISFHLANRLYGAESYAFRPEFLELLQRHYGAPLQRMDFLRKAPECRQIINDWVAEQTRQRITELLPDLSPAARLVLVNAVYLKAPWAKEFSEYATAPRPFHVDGGAAQDRPTMLRQAEFGYRKFANFSAVTVPYSGGELQFLALVPDEIDGLPAVEKSLSSGLLAECAGAPAADVVLELPKFKLQPDRMSLGGYLAELGMKQAFDIPGGSADFSRMAARSAAEYLYVSVVYHKTFLALDEKGTEAAAATAVVMMPGAAAPTERPKPIELKVNRPFLFAIQHRASGSCLFLGRVSDPK